MNLRGVQNWKKKLMKMKNEKMKKMKVEGGGRRGSEEKEGRKMVGSSALVGTGLHTVRKEKIFLPLGMY